MRRRWLCDVGLFFLVLGFAGPAFAQGSDAASQEVKRAVERAVGASVSSAVAESLSRSIVSEGMRQVPKTTVFGGPFFNRTDGSVETRTDEGDFKASFKIDTYGGVLGVLQKINDYLLVHGAFSGAGTHAKGEFEDLSGSLDAKLFDLRLGGDVVFLNTQPVKGWFTLEGGVSRFEVDINDSDINVDPVWTWRVAPSATFSVHAGPVLFEPTTGFAFARPFDGVDDPELTISWNAGFALKYRGERFRPQLNFAYQRVIHPSSVATNDDGVISVGPEVLFAVTPNILLGASYTYSTPLKKNFTVDSSKVHVQIDSHTATLEFRWIF